MLKKFLHKDLVEAGCDEAGRGCLAGPVYAAAVILPKKFRHPLINDSKQLNAEQRKTLRPIIEENAVAWAVAFASAQEIDEINILNASFLAMHRTIDQLTQVPEALLIDGNRFNKYKEIPHFCIIEGDAKYLNIAAASILAKTYRDEFMEKLHEHYPEYGWITNKGYATEFHRMALEKHGQCEHHRKSFTLKAKQLSISFNDEMEF